MPKRNLKRRAKNTLLPLRSISHPLHEKRKEKESTESLIYAEGLGGPGVRSVFELPLYFYSAKMLHHVILNVLYVTRENEDCVYTIWAKIERNSPPSHCYDEDPINSL